MEESRELVAALLQPQAYPEGPQEIELVETHISHVFLTGQHVYKVKKPVDFGFLDFTTLARRRYFCHMEVVLNRRLAPDVYLGVVEIRRLGEQYAVEGLGETVKYAVKMRQLPRDRVLGRLLQRYEVTHEAIRRVAGLIADFHARAETVPERAHLGAVDAVVQNTQESFVQTVDHIGLALSQDAYDDLKAYTEAFLEVREPLFRARTREGRVRDCHGDLHAAHVFMENGISIIDCIEFNQRFRYADVASDIAFLAMDLDCLGHPDLSDVLVEEYVRVSQDREVRDLLDFYKTYRAYVRGKVECFRLGDASISQEERDEARARARRDFALAHSYLEGIVRPTLFITTGLAGTGKSHTARELARRWTLEILSSDVVRKEMAGIPPTERRLEAFGEGIYSPELSAKTYRRLFEGAEGYLSQGKSVILDAAFGLAAEREQAANLAREQGVYLVVLECVAPGPLVRERLERRQHQEGEASDGRWEIYQQQLQVFEPLVEVEAGSRIVVDNSAPEEVAMSRLLREVFSRWLAS